jgi:Flp pilus assembly protein TadD
VTVPGEARRSAVTWGRAAAEKLPLLLLSAASSVATYLAQARGGAVRTWEDFPVQNGAATALVAAAGYLWKSLRPTRLAFFYPIPEAGHPWLLVALAAVTLIGGSLAALAAARRGPWWAVGWCWFLGMLVPVIGFPVRVGSQAMADRYTYLPMTGLFLAAAIGILGVTAGWRGRRKGAAVAAGMVLAVTLAVLAGRQVGVWRDSETLFRHAIEVTRGNWPAHNGLGTILAREGRIDEAIGHYRAAIAIDARAPRPHFNLGLAMAYRGAWQQALVHYQDALRLDGDYIRAHYQAGIAYLRLGRLDEAEASFRRAWDRDPESVEIIRHLGLVRAERGDRAGALDFLGRALAMEPGRLDIRDEYRRVTRGEPVVTERPRDERGGDGPGA